MRLSGTSMAAAVVSGVVALTLEASRTAADDNHPPLTPNAVKAVLQHTALPVAGNDMPSAASDPLAEGAGMVNAAGATEMAKRLDTTAAPGQRWLTSGLSPATAIAGRLIPWVQRFTWRGRPLLGDAAYTNLPAFGQGTSWDSHIVWGDHVVWGDHIVWGSNQSWGNHIVWGDTTVGRVDDDHIVWGDHTFAEDDVAWGNLAASEPTRSGTQP
jgi:hypothetical protein